MFLPSLRALILEPLSLLISLTPLHRFLPQQDHFAPHPGAPFEGYYTRVVTTTGATVLLIFSSVYTAHDKPHYLHFSYLPPGSTGPAAKSKSILVNRFPDIRDVPRKQDPVSGRQGFRRDAEGDGIVGQYVVGKDGVSYRITVEDDDARSLGGALEIDIMVSGRTEWKRGDQLSTPEGIFSRLVFLLPLHWNVLSTASRAVVRINRGDGTVIEDSTGVAHVEKNWGVEFPRGWTWIQGFSPSPAMGKSSPPDSESPLPTTTFALAGGKILGQKAYLLGYRSQQRAWSFSPPWSLLPFTLSMPFISEHVDSRAGRFGLRVSGLWKKLEVDAVAPGMHEGWIGMACPLAKGHGNTYAYETFEGVVRVRCYERTWTGGWDQVEEAVFEGAAVEFGGEYSFRARKSGLNGQERG